MIPESDKIYWIIGMVLIGSWFWMRVISAMFIGRVDESKADDKNKMNQRRKIQKKIQCIDTILLFIASLTLIWYLSK